MTNRDYALTDALVNNYLDVVTPTDGSPLSLIVPGDAGSQTFPLYASAIKQMEGQLYDLAVLVTPSPTGEAELQTKGVVHTPLGTLEVNRRAAKTLQALAPDFLSVKIGAGKASHLVEDKLDVLAAFLKQIAPYIKVLPVFAPQSVSEGRKLGRALAELLKDMNAVVISQADLDQTLLAALEYNDPGVFEQTAALLENKPGSELDQPEISAAPAAVALAYAAAAGSNTISVLGKSVRSGMHHAAVMLWDYQAPQLSPAQENELLRLATAAIESYVTTGEIPENVPDDPIFKRKSGVFVTLRIRGMLRGCIGHMAAEKPLAQAVQEMAVAAATSDPRFPPLTRLELEQITIKIAILSPLQRIDYPQVEVGKHGLLISYSGRRGVLLPEVPTDRGWDRDTFLENLCYKAGLPGDTWRKNPTLYAFTSVVFGKD